MQSFFSTMDSHIILQEGEQDHPMRLRKAVSDMSSLSQLHIYKDMEATILGQAKEAKCELCELTEYFTPAYIARVEDSYSGKFVCGLCCEAVKERLARAPTTELQDALSSHRDFCQKFNVTRLNPKLSLTFAMKDIVKRSCQVRGSSSSLNKSSKFSRTTSCVSRIDFSMNN